MSHAQGQFDIVKLSGSFMPLESCNQNRHSGELRVMLARADGHVFGGGLAGPMMAASSVLVSRSLYCSGICLSQYTWIYHK